MKLTINADAFALTSELKVEDIELLAKVNPDALKIKDKDGNELFAVSYSAGKPAISSFCVQFGGVSRDGSGKATITGTIPSDITTNEAAKDFVAEKVGKVVINLKKLEETVPDAAKTINEARKELVDSITIG